MQNVQTLPDGPAFAVLYAAKSTDDVRGSLPRQLADGKELALRRGWTVVDEYSDNAKSAYRGNRGEGLADAKAHAERLARQHGTCHLVVQHTDRLARGDGVQADHLVELALWARRSGVQIQSVQDPATCEGGLAFAAMMGDRNNADSERKGFAVAGGIHGAALRGDWVGGHCADGYIVRREPKLDEPGRTLATVEKDPERMELWRTIFELALEGWSTEAITTEVDRRGWITRPRRKDHKPRPFDAYRINQSMGTPMYAGLTVYRGEVVGTGHWEPYVSPEDFYRLAAERRARGNVDKRKAGRPAELFLLTGLVRCGVCGGTMRNDRGRTPRTTKGGTRARTYVCEARKIYRPGHQSRCEGPIFDADVVDPLVLEHLPALLGDSDGVMGELLAGRAAERERLVQEATRAQADIAECERVLVKMAKRLDAAVADDDEDAQELLLRTVKARRQEAKAAEQRLAAALDALSVATEETPEAQRAAFYERLHGQLTGRLDGARDDVKATNLVLREFFSHMVLSETAAGLRIAPQLSDAAAARILRDVQRWPHGAEVQVGGYAAEVVGQPGVTEGAEMELIVRVPRGEVHGALEAMQRDGGTVELTTPVIGHAIPSHIHEDQRLPVAGHEVDLPVPRAVVARHDRAAQALQVLGGQALAEAAEVLTGIGGHAGDAMSERVPGQHAPVTILRSGRCETDEPAP
ncbi:MAG TPA: recombinase family protein [Baekduia sp.]|nr:recombinase family protein [Baekduia sp.]HMJ37137.1 recombinase family protein [Baekduia sp.]